MRDPAGKTTTTKHYMKDHSKKINQLSKCKTVATKNFASKTWRTSFSNESRIFAKSVTQHFTKKV